LYWKFNFLNNFFFNYSYVRFHENESSGSWVFPCGQTDRGSDMTKLIVAFRNYANALKVINIIRKWKTTSYNSFYTYLLIPWGRVFLEKLTCLNLVKKFPAFYGTRRFITALTTAHQLPLS
jgi:hypothetical protein